MSNVKRVKIQGDLNMQGVLVAAGYDDDHLDLSMAEIYRYHRIPEQDAEEAVKAARLIRNFMAQTVVPYFGLKFEFDGSQREEENLSKGIVGYLRYVIAGEEAVSYPFLESLVGALEQWGGVYVNKVEDNEG